MKTDFYYSSCGAGVIHGCRWTPEGDVKAVVQIIHGIGEHVQRYDEFAGFLADHGILVIAEDHMGHGRSISEDCPKGCFIGGWNAAVEDCYYLLRETMTEFPGVPYVLFGHSMGSFLARSMLCAHPNSGISAAILSGTGWQSKFIVKLGQLISGVVCKLQEKTKSSALLLRLCFSSYNARIKSPKTVFDWLTRDEALVAAYNADYLCGYTIASASLIRDMMNGLAYIQNPKNLDKMNRNLPVCFTAGDADPVGNYGKGVNQTAKVFKKHGMKHVDVKIYPDCRHELHNELNRQAFFEDILQWINGTVNK